MTKELIAKLEALEAPDEAVFREVFFHINPPPHGMARNDGWANLRASFFTMITASAWESAAIMLKPEGSLYELSEERDCAVLNYDNSARRVYTELEGRSPAIALLICILKAKEPVK